jgi:hypothetical protein
MKERRREEKVASKPLESVEESREVDEVSERRRR